MGRVSDARERLMNAVSELIWTGSYGTTTIDHICERAGVKVAPSNSTSGGSGAAVRDPRSRNRRR